MPHLPLYSIFEVPAGIVCGVRSCVATPPSTCVAIFIAWLRISSMCVACDRPNKGMQACLAALGFDHGAFEILRVSQNDFLRASWPQIAALA